VGESEGELGADFSSIVSPRTYGDQAPGIDTAGVSDGHGEVPETQSRDLTRALEGGDDESDENDGDYVPEEGGEDKDKEQSKIEYNDFDESGADEYYNLTKGTEGPHHK
jgi:hypothetical protein